MSNLDPNNGAFAGGVPRPAVTAGYTIIVGQLTLNTLSQNNMSPRILM